jgi:hypothetical protein
MTTFPRTFATLVPTLATVAALATPAAAGPYDRNIPRDFIDASGTIYSGERFGYELLGYGGGYAYVELGSDQCRADLDVVVYDDIGEVVASGTSPYCDESISWFVAQDTVYYVQVLSFEGATTDFYVGGGNEWSH